MLGIIGAMEIETAGLIEKMSDKKVVKCGNYTFVEGKIGNGTAVVCRCGIGKVFSSTAAVLMIEKFGVDEIVNLGVAGGAKPLKQGDVAIADKTVQYDYDATPDGLVLGQIHGFNSPYFECDKTMVNRFDEILSSCGYTHKIGTIASGDCFVNSHEKSTAISATFGAIAYDMESAAINQVCAYQGVKYCALRAISDNGDDDAVKSFYAFVTEAATRSINVLTKYIEKYA